ncbi:sensor histidine kinase [Brevundimonas lenta]|uniref:histidine kinase n=1 Tax=Brevundimonas lenta TaxID=424796 RepID=A0A7W6JDK9_9CAUL|nr:HAMP domain-containing sensor histidine kinase [Brevundimonas lenta]MBB4082213.1 signal transduction histidine kinase [Brevundimonas lenta]
MSRKSISRRLQARLAWITGLAALALLGFVAFDIDRMFDQHYSTLGLTGLAYEIGDHVVLPVLVILLPLLITTPWLVRQGLMPLETAAERVDATSGKDRGFRVETEDLPEEAVPFVNAVNNLLTRLDEAAERQEAFAADIAHELKTPLAILKLEMDVYGDELADKVKADIGAMNRLIDQLLLIAQLDASVAARSPWDRVALREVAEDVIGRLAARAINDDIRLELQVVEPVTVYGRREALAAALRNLIENSLRVTPAGQRVTVFVGPSAQLRVRDGGKGLSPEQLSQLSRRHARADHASKTGAGLGLAIVSKIMGSHGGRLETRPDRRELCLVFGEEAAAVAPKRARRKAKRPDPIPGGQ